MLKLSHVLPLLSFFMSLQYSPELRKLKTPFPYSLDVLQGCFNLQLDHDKWTLAHHKQDVDRITRWAEVT